MLWVLQKNKGKHHRVRDFLYSLKDIPMADVNAPSGERRNALLKRPSLNALRHFGMD